MDVISKLPPPARVSFAVLAISGVLFAGLPHLVPPFGRTEMAPTPPPSLTVLKTYPFGYPTNSLDTHTWSRVFRQAQTMLGETPRLEMFVARKSVDFDALGTYYRGALGRQWSQMPPGVLDLPPGARSYAFLRDGGLFAPDDFFALVSAMDEEDGRIPLNIITNLDCPEDAAQQGFFHPCAMPEDPDLATPALRTNKTPAPPPELMTNDAPEDWRGGETFSWDLQAWTPVFDLAKQRLGEKPRLENYRARVDTDFTALKAYYAGALGPGWVEDTFLSGTGPYLKHRAFAYFVFIRKGELFEPDDFFALVSPRRSQGDIIPVTIITNLACSDEYARSKFLPDCGRKRASMAPS